MGYLNEVFNEYYDSVSHKDKVNIINDFREKIWGSLPYLKLNKSFKYRVVKECVDNNLDYELLLMYNNMKYKVLKSRYNINELEKEDLVKARINSNYGKYFDKEVYLSKDYYRCLANFKNIYFKYINQEIEGLETEIYNNASKLNELKTISESRKIELSWDDYKSLINLYIDKIFDNFIPIDNKINKGEFNPNHVLDWDEDNYILSYVNKSLNGYIKNYINEQLGNRKNKEYKKCVVCNKSFVKKSNKSKYCSSCAREIESENHKKRNKKWYENKIRTK